MRKQERTWEDELEVCSRRDMLSAMNIVLVKGEPFKTYELTLGNYTTSSTL